MTGKRYYAAGGIRDRGEGLAFPFVVIFGPSGQAVQLPYPKGYVDDTHFFPAAKNNRIPHASTTDGSNVFGAGVPENIAAYDMTFSQVQIEWYRNHLVSTYLDDAYVGNQLGIAFQPYGQPLNGFFPYHSGASPLTASGRGQPRINAMENATGGSTFNESNGVDLFQRVAMDGFHWIQPYYRSTTGFGEMYGYKKIPGGMFWTYQEGQGKAYSYGLWEAKFPHFKFVSEIASISPFFALNGSGWKGESGSPGNPNINNDEVFSTHGGNPGNTDQYCGIKSGGTNMSNLSKNTNDIICHKGHVWIATQYSLMCVSPGGKMHVVNDERGDDSYSGDIPGRSTPANMAGYSYRAENDAFGGPASRSLAELNGELYMLTNKGSLFLVRPGGIREIADLTEVGTFASSGVLGGSLADNPLSDGSWAGSSSAHRCKLITFNGQLHAFLNFRSSFQLAKAENADDPTQGRGVFWATSHDGVSWSDRSPNLPGSGIVKPSGTLGEWLVDIAPYRFSGTPGSVFPSGVLPNGENTIDYPNTAGMAGPSGFSQEGILHTWASGVGYINSFNNNVGTSGVLLDNDGISFDQLRVPLAFTRRTRSLYPTSVINPASYGFINVASGRIAAVPLASGSGGVYSPSGVGVSGYDYTGCRNYHVSAFIDEVDHTLKVSFSEDYNDGGTLVFELNQTSGWRHINHIRDSKQLNGLIPIDMYDPEVIIPSGSQRLPNPRHDPVNKTMTVDYEVFDWPFWRTVNIETQYSINDGVTWNDIGTIKNISTGTQTTDPSGIVGTQNTFVWDYSDHLQPSPLSRSAFYPSVQIRMRGRDANFINPV